MSLRAGELWRRFSPVVWLTLTLWAAHFVNIALDGAMTRSLGLIPRELKGLDGVVAMPLLHGSWEHLTANTAPILLLGGILLAVAPRRFWLATVVCVLLGGLLTWLLGRGQTNHIGASGLIFAWFGFLVAHGLIERSFRAVAGAVAALALHGAPTLLGLAPEDPRVSWDGHLAGLAAGVITAWALRPRHARSARAARG